MVATRRSTRRSAGRTPNKYDPEEEASKPQWRSEEIIEAEEVAEEEADAAIADEEEDEEFEMDSDDDGMTNIHFGLASRAMLEGESGEAPTGPLNAFVIQAAVELGAAVTLVLDTQSFGPGPILVTNAVPPQVVWLVAALLASIGVASWMMRDVEPGGGRSAFCFGCITYHVAVIVVACFICSTGDTFLLGAPLAAKTKLPKNQQALLIAGAASAVHFALAALLYNKAMEDDDEVLVVWEDDDDEDEEDEE